MDMMTATTSTWTRAPMSLVREVSASTGPMTASRIMPTMTAGATARASLA